MEKNKKNNSLTEYLFIDEKRLDNYCEQFGAQTKFDKEISVSAEISIPPKAIIEVNTSPRPLNKDEKITKLINSLKKGKKGFLLFKRPTENKEICNLQNLIFVYESLIANKFIIPTKEISNNKDLIIWLSSPEIDKKESIDMLCLIEDYCKDENQQSRYIISGFSILVGLLVALKDKIKETIIYDKLPTGEFNYQWYLNNSLIVEEFINNPYSKLIDLGCKCVIERKIKTLYKIRNYGPDESTNRKTISTIGYPIFIAEDGI